MRCPSCGTENEPDSRFCGGCGNRLQSTLAPTHKIVADTPPPHAPVAPAVPAVAQQAQAIARQVSAEYAAQRQSAPRSAQPQATPPPAVHRHPTPAPVQPRLPSAPQAAQPVRPSSPQPVPRAASVPGVYAAPRATPRDGGAAIGSSSRGSAPRSGARSVERSIAAPRRNWALIIAVLLVDLGLAAAGVYLLTEGLAAGKTSATEAAPTTETAPKVGATPAPAPAPAPAARPTPTPAPAPAPAGTASAVIAPPVDAGVAVADPPDDKREPDKTGSASPPQGRKVLPKRKPKDPKRPIDPYEDLPPPDGTVIGPVGPPPPDDTGLR